MTDIVNPAITAAAQHVAQAEIEAQEKTQAHREIENEVTAMRARLADFEVRRRDIGVRRAAGDQRDADGADLALIAADAEALAAILTRREADVAAARAQAEAAIRNLQQARAGLQRAEDQAVETALTARAEELGQALTNAIDELRTVRNRLGGGRLPWVPSRALANHVVSLDLGRPW
jgi:chromosome segregation ATPase